MSERRNRRPREEQARPGMGQAGAPQLQIPQRENAALEAESARLEAMARGGGSAMPMGMPGAPTPGRLPGGMPQGNGNIPFGSGMSGPGGESQYPAEPRREIPAESPVRTSGEEEAYQLGSRMGAESLAQMNEAVTRIRQPIAPIDEKRIIEAEAILQKYKSGKSSVDRRIINAQQWWKLKNWEQIEARKGDTGATRQKSATAWLWNCIVGKHAEAMDAYPEPVILPRMEEDKAEAQILSSIIPVILSINGFEEVYNSAMWQKFQEGTGAYYVGWDKTKLGGIGDVSVRNVSLLQLYWEPGVEDIEDSENLFFTQLVNTKQLEMQHPNLKGKLSTNYLKPAEYIKDDSVSTDGKCVLVDWYYHTWEGNRKILHYCQFANHQILYSTENNGDTEGLYTDGEYPFVLDPLYPVHGSPAGYGLIDIAQDAQQDIDTLNQAMVLNAVVTSTPRWFFQGDGGINEEEYMDWRKPLVKFTGSLDDRNLRPIEAQGIQGSALQMLNNKIEELKFVTGNTDVQAGSSPSGVTAASAIAALQEAHGRSSKDSSRGGYRANVKIVTKCIERIRQGYNIPRQFRILGPNGQQQFVSYNNAKLQEQTIMGGMGLEPGLRKPVFDIDVRSERENSYTRMSQNEMAIQFMQLGVFNPQMTDQMLMMLDMMDFPKKEELIQKVQQNGTMFQTLMQVGQIALALGQKFQPEIIPQLMAVLQQIGMEAGMMPQKGGNLMQVQERDATGGIKENNGIVRNARERSQEATRPQ